MKSVLTKHQMKVYGPKYYKEHGEDYSITAHVRYDDECGNGHNTFAITGVIKRKDERGRWVWDCGGCIHESIAKHFPELAPYIKWHLVSSDGPLHYPGNAVYLAGVRDCWGKLKGEVRSYEKRVSFLGFPITFKFDGAFMKWLEEKQNGFNPGDLQLLAVPYKEKPGGYKFAPHYTFAGFPVSEWYQAPFKDVEQAKEMQQALNEKPFVIVSIPDSWGEGKERELELARSSAIWPEATDEQLCADNLEEVLRARLPGLMKEFKKDIKALGFVF